MIYINAKRLLLAAVENGILAMKGNCIPIYREAGTPPEEYPEGWYLEDIEDLSQDLMHDTDGQEAIIAALAEKGVQFEELKLPPLRGEKSTTSHTEESL